PSILFGAKCRGYSRGSKRNPKERSRPSWGRDGLRSTRLGVRRQWLVHGARKVLARRWRLSASQQPIDSASTWSTGTRKVGGEPEPSSPIRCDVPVQATSSCTPCAARTDRTAHTAWI